MAWMDWNALEQTCMGCQRCALADGRHNVVFGVGSRDAEVLFVGEGPGENEDLQGEPFVGRAGKLLDDMLELIDLDRQTDRVRVVLHRLEHKVDLESSALLLRLRQAAEDRA